MLFGECSTAPAAVGANRSLKFLSALPLRLPSLSGRFRRAFGRVVETVTVHVRLYAYPLRELCTVALLIDANVRWNELAGIGFPSVISSKMRDPMAILVAAVAWESKAELSEQLGLCKPKVMFGSSE